MKFEVTKKSYINDDIVEEGSIIDLDLSVLAKTKDGKIDFSKHSALKPLEEVSYAPENVEPVDPVVEPNENGGESGDENPPELTDEEKAQAIKDALEALDPEDDEAWTRSGAPKVDSVSEIVGIEVSRADINAVAPEFTRPQSE